MRRQHNGTRRISIGWRARIVSTIFALSVLLAATAAPARGNPVAESAQVELHRALELAQRGQSQQALEQTRALLQRHPGYVPALKLEGMLLEEAGRTADAEVCYESGLKLAPNDSDLLFKVGLARLLAGDRDQAILLFQRHLRLEPSDGDALYYLAQAEHLAGHDDQALKAIKACLAVQPDNAAVWQKYGELLISSGDSEAAFTWLQKAADANPQLPRLSFDLGVAALGRMDLESAERYARKAAEQRPGDAEALALLASVEVKMAHWSEADTNYQRVLALNGNDRAALLGLGHCQLEEKQFSSAAATLTQLLNLDPLAVLAHYYLARAYAGLGNGEEARHQSELHDRMMQQSSFAASALGSEQDKAVWEQARHLLADGQEEQALRLFAAQQAGPSASVGHPYFLVGALYLYTGSAAKGIDFLHQALAHDPRTRGAHTYLGIYALQQGQLQVAEREFATEIALDPNYETAVAELGLVRYRQQRWAEAADQLVRSHTRTPALLLALADAQFHLGKAKEARLNVEIAAAYARDDQQLLDDAIDLLRRNGENDLADRLGGEAKP